MYFGLRGDCPWIRLSLLSPLFTAITIPKSATKIKSAFYNCDNLKETRTDHGDSSI